MQCAFLRFQFWLDIANYSTIMMQLDSRVHCMRMPSGTYQTLYISTRFDK